MAKFGNRASVSTIGTVYATPGAVDTKIDVSQSKVTMRGRVPSMLRMARTNFSKPFAAESADRFGAKKKKGAVVLALKRRSAYLLPSGVGGNSCVQSPPHR